ncbi:MAG TPA: hypothetical protein VNW28_08975 [Chthoniobacterales bacterium]|jgi:hypothetical protein|nr:hypothetical protein [Chthoniobacterales bacterium]
MRLPFLTLTILLSVITLAAPSFGAGGDQQESELEAARHQREHPAQSATPPVAVAQAPYNLGQAIFNGTYKFGKAKANHVPEKAHRLGILQGGLPAAEQKHFHPQELAGHLNDREMNALEYYIQVKFGAFVTVAPSWAKEEPPIKVK